MVKLYNIIPDREFEMKYSTTIYGLREINRTFSIREIKFQQKVNTFWVIFEYFCYSLKQSYMNNFNADYTTKKQFK